MAYKHFLYKIITYNAFFILIISLNILLYPINIYLTLESGIVPFFICLNYKYLLLTLGSY